MRDATLGLSASFTNQFRSGLFVGIEARYLRKYDGLGFDPFAGEALLIGPTFYAQLSKSWAVSGGWGIQVAGHAVDVPGALDLKNFERHQAFLRVAYNF